MATWMNMIAARNRHRAHRWLVLVVVMAAACLGIVLDANAGLDAQQRAEHVSVLREALADETRWVKVHAAEHLLELSYPQGVEEAFRGELGAYGDEPEYRTGIWRVLAQSARSQQEREQWVNRIRAVAFDENTADRVHALEALAKVRYAPVWKPAEDRQSESDWEQAGEVETLQAIASDVDDDAAAFAQWVLAYAQTGEADYDARAELLDLVQSDDAVTRLRAAVALRVLGQMDESGWARLAAAGDAEPTSSLAYVWINSAAYVLAPEPEHGDRYLQRLLNVAPERGTSERREIVLGMADRATMDDLPTLARWAQDEDEDVRLTAAYAMLRVDRRQEVSLGWLDWPVLILYGLGMLMVGYYYARLARTSDDYLLGGRMMSPWKVGLSLFATLLSSLTYLAGPGEIIQNGPMFMAGVLAMPFIFAVLGWFLVPYFMRLPITSAYELLDARLGPWVGVAGSVAFLGIRLFWMATIIYISTAAVLIPVFGLDARYIPWISALMALVTLAYTSMGGLRAVVLTDVVQTFILIMAAALAITLVSYHFGGVGAWLPRSWDPDWAELRWGFHPTERMTVLNIMLMSFVWMVFTAGSDQMAVQRYLATRDVGAARRMLGISLVANAGVTLLLGALGLALFAYFRSEPHLLPDGQTLAESADTLLPRYMVYGLPIGLSGLVVAGLLAAAMSSLSSGFNSSSSVITVDLIDRFSKRKLSERQQVWRARLVTIFIGVVIVLLSSLVVHVPGNLFDVLQRVGNLLVAPLFVLFFMALFVPWARSFGTLMGLAASVIAAIAVAFFGVFGIGVLWIMPTAFLCGVTVGCALSLVPVGSRVQPWPESPR